MFGGIAVLGRLHVVVIVAVLGLFVGWARRDPRIVLRVGVGSAAFVVVLCAWNHWVYGTWSPTAAYETSMFAEYARNKGLELAPNQLGTWFAPDRGLFVWTPVLLVLAPALVRNWKNLPDWSRALVFGGLAYSVLQCFLDDYDGGFGFYGYRLGLEMLACLTPAVALSAPHCGPDRPLADRPGAGRAAVRHRDRRHQRQPDHAAVRATTGSTTSSSAQFPMPACRAGCSSAASPPWVSGGAGCGTTSATASPLRSPG